MRTRIAKCEEVEERWKTFDYLPPSETTLNTGVSKKKVEVEEKFAKLWFCVNLGDNSVPFNFAIEYFALMDIRHSFLGNSYPELGHYWTFIQRNNSIITYKTIFWKNKTLVIKKKCVILQPICVM